MDEFKNPPPIDWGNPITELGLYKTPAECAELGIPWRPLAPSQKITMRFADPQHDDFRIVFGLAPHLET